MTHQHCTPRFCSKFPRKAILLHAQGDPNHRSQNGTLTGPELAGRVYGLLDSRNTGTSERTVILLSGQNDPNGIAWHNGSLYVAELNKITRYDHADSYVLANKASPPACKLCWCHHAPIGRC